MAILKKVKQNYQNSILKGNENLCISKACIVQTVYHSIMHNCLNMETTQIFIN